MNEVFTHAAFGQFVINLCLGPLLPLRCVFTYIFALLQGIDNHQNLLRHIPFLTRLTWKVAWYVVMPLIKYGWEGLTRSAQELLNKEIEELRAKSTARRAAREREQQGGDVSMDEVGVVPSVVVA